ncbi:hypothetical protein Z042_23100 [Chania multitudinisentens RB-25]|uniref:DUF1367 family protein n=1 Tax=Chania multitudinisentens RB-25 TaxID=1441930 RepID=W0LEK8_9GAMM|nr:DUF1367 family protein [Chania multitudinisentens]AHG22176.1 hypothetical protein Z042_23100 [Chania multitudinisentens RB-25]
MTAAPRTKSLRKQKTEALGVLLPGGGIKYATDHDRNVMKGMPVGTPISMSPIGDRRNLKHHRKFWKLIELGMDYWEPEWAFVSDSERWIAIEAANKTAKMMAEMAGDPSLYENVTKQIADRSAEETLNRMATRRKSRFDAELIKTEEAYLNRVMIKAGFYDLIPNPDGGTLKQRWSIAFANMDQGKFDAVYRGVAGVIWNETLQQHFADEHEMEQAVNRLMEY